jgi:hypothetical protein
MPGFLTLLAALWMAAPCETAFCRCAQSPAVAEARAEAAAVFTGTVVSVRPGRVNSGDDHPHPTHQAVLRVHSVWKGVASDTVVVATTASMCGFWFEPGKSYLVYASPWGDAPLTTSICGRTKPLDRAGADLRALGEPSRHWSRPSRSSQRGE